MISERISRAIHVETRLPPEDLRSIFAQCGDLRGIYAAGGSDDGSRSRYYVEFSDLTGVKQAGVLQVPNIIAIDALSLSPHLVGQFQTLLSATLPQKPPADVLETANRSPIRRLPKKPRQEQIVRDKHRPRTYAVVDPSASMSHSTFDLSRTLPGAFDKENNVYTGLDIDWRDHMSEATTAKDGPTLLQSAYPMHAEYHPPSFSFASSLTPSSSNASDLSSAFSLPLPGVSVLRRLLDSTSSLCLTYGGELYPIDLENLNESPDEIIALLKAAANHPVECAKWMVIGAHYRGRANLQAAIAVITTMIEVMLHVGMESSQLKPATLMLASCHMDVARRLRTSYGTETAESKHHLDRACEGFRMAYGTFEFPPSSPFGNARSDNATAGPGNAQTSFDVNAAQQNSPTKPPTTPKPTPRAPRSSATPRMPGCPIPSPGQMQVLEREVQSLRDRQKTQFDSLKCAKSAKRKLEDLLDREQQRRRKLEGQLDKAEKAASGAQRGEEYALGQCRIEVETRRRAEEHVQELKAAITAMEPKLMELEERERKTRDYFGKLGVAFLKAARGDIADAPTALRI